MLTGQPLTRAGVASHRRAAAPKKDLSDEELLDRFVLEQDQASFTNLVGRHGPMVMAVCHRVLRHSQDAEDAFQATFLVLARKACTLEKPELLSNWLYGVAYRTAQHARSRTALRRQREAEAAAMAPAPSDPDPISDDLIGSLDAALHSLPDKYRAPLILCYLEGKTNLEAARLLGIPAGSMSSRLARGRELLRERLADRWASGPYSDGPPTLHSAILSAVPARLAVQTAEAAVGLMGGQPITDLVVSDAVKELMRATLQSLHPPPPPRWLLAAWLLLWLAAAVIPWPALPGPGNHNPSQPPSRGPTAGAPRGLPLSAFPLTRGPAGARGTPPGPFISPRRLRAPRPFIISTKKTLLIVMRCIMRSPWRCLLERQPRRRPRPVRPSLEALEDRCVPSAAFVQTNLVSDIPGMAATLDPNLKNPWGLASGPGGPWWVANQRTGTSTLYDNLGNPDSLVVNIPTNPNGSFFTHGAPTGIVFNTPGTGFNVTEAGNTGSSIFLFATLDGTISGWSPGVDFTNAVVGATNPGASYTGLAIDTVAGHTRLYAADFAKGTIDVYNADFKQITKPGSFTDPHPLQGYSPFNIQNINGKLYVEYAKVDPKTGRAQPGGGNGVVDVFNADGTFAERLISHGQLNDPWGVALAPANFGAFSGDLLVGNFGDGHINAFDPKTHAFVGELTTTSGKVFEEDHLWSLHFGQGGAAGSPNTLFFTAGINNEHDGLFGSLQAVPTLAAGSPIVPKLGDLPKQSVSTVPPNGDVNPYGVAFVPQNYHGGGVLSPGDILVSNFNNSTNTQGTGSTIVRITPDGQHSVFFQGGSGLGLSTALGVLPQGFVIVGNVPTSTAPDGSTVVHNGSLLIIDSNGNQVGEISDPTLLQGPWDLAVNTSGGRTQVFVSNVLSGTVTRIDFSIPKGGIPQVVSETQIASGYAHRSDPTALVIGPTGLAYDPKTGTLYVASTGDNAVYAIRDAANTGHDRGRGVAVIQGSPHLHGPLGLALAPNGDLILSNGDAVSPNAKESNELVEFTPQGKFVGEFQFDSGNPGAAFGIALQDVNGQVRLAAVNDNINALEVWTFQLPVPHPKG